MEEEKKKELLTDEEFEKLGKMSYTERSRWSPSSAILEKCRNTVEAHETDMKTVEGLKRFIETGVLVNDQMIVAVEKASSMRRAGTIFIRALSQGEMGGSSTAVRVELTIQEVTRFRKILQVAVDVGRRQRQINVLKEILKDRRGRRSFR